MNGIISFGREFTTERPSLFPFSVPSPLTGRQLIAPFWANVDTRMEGGVVSYEVHTTADELVRRVSAFISNRKGIQFDGAGMLLADWNRVHQYPHGDAESVSENTEVTRTVVLDIQEFGMITIWELNS